VDPLLHVPTLHHGYIELDDGLPRQFIGKISYDEDPSLTDHGDEFGESRVGAGRQLGGMQQAAVHDLLLQLVEGGVEIGRLHPVHTWDRRSLSTDPEPSHHAIPGTQSRTHEEIEQLRGHAEDTSGE
jgi:hypothetical protein